MEISSRQPSNWVGEKVVRPVASVRCSLHHSHLSIKLTTWHDCVFIWRCRSADVDFRGYQSPFDTSIPIVLDWLYRPSDVVGEDVLIDPVAELLWKAHKSGMFLVGILGERRKFDVA